jgi:hypothetical protein
VESRTNGTMPSLLWILCQAANRPNNTHQIQGGNRFSFEGRRDSKRCMGIKVRLRRDLGRGAHTHIFRNCIRTQATRIEPACTWVAYACVIYN